MSFEAEQMEILKVVEKNVVAGGYPWNKYNGDVCCRIIKKYLEEYMPEGYKVVGPNAYINGFSTEFDLLIVDKDITPMMFTNAYPIKSIHYILEIKKRGVYGGRRDLQRVVKQLHSNFALVTSRNPQIKCVYVTIQEVGEPKRKDSINYLKETKKALYPFEVFAMKESRSNEMIRGEWKRLVDYIVSKSP